MRIIEIAAGPMNVAGPTWTLEITEELEQRIAISLKGDACVAVSDDEIKEFFLDRLFKDSEMLSLEIVKG